MCFATLENLLPFKHSTGKYLDKVEETVSFSFDVFNSVMLFTGKASLNFLLNLKLFLIDTFSGL